MTRSRPNIALAFAVVAALAAPGAVRAQTQPVGAPVMDGLQNQSNTRANNAKMMQRGFQTRSLFRAEDRIMMESRYGMAPFLPPPVLAVEADPDVDEIHTLAAGFQKPYFPERSVAEIETYERARLGDFRAAAKREGIPPDSLASACDYLTETLYLVGGHVDASAQRESIRGTCAASVAIFQSTGKLHTNAERLAAFQYRVIVGGFYRERAAAANGNAAKRAAIAGDAQTLFKRMNGHTIAEMPPAQYQCLLAFRELTCPRIQSEYPPVFEKLLANDR